jgi:hypothetical protein
MTERALYEREAPSEIKRTWLDLQGVHTLCYSDDRKQHMPTYEEHCHGSPNPSIDEL